MKIKKTLIISIFYYLAFYTLFSCSVEKRKSAEKLEKMEIENTIWETDSNSLKDEIRDLEFEYNFEKKNYEEITNAIEVIRYDLRIDDSNKKFLNIKAKITSKQSINNIRLYYGDMASYGNSYSDNQGIYSEFNINPITYGTIDLKLYSDKLPSKIDFERQKDQEKYYDSLNTYGPPDTLADGSTIRKIIAYPKHDVFIYRIRYDNGEYIESASLVKLYRNENLLKILRDSLISLRNRNF